MASPWYFARLIPPQSDRGHNSSALVRHRDSLCAVRLVAETSEVLAGLRREVIELRNSRRAGNDRSCRMVAGACRPPFARASTMARHSVLLA